MTVNPKFAYHVTSYERAVKIIDSGKIDPTFSEGRNQVSWYVGRSMITWAIAHCCRHREVELEKVVILTVKLKPGDIKRANKRGIYWSTRKLNIIEMSSATMWLAREEKTLFIKGKGQKPFRADKDED